ncbi:LuxR C-terminal-related transcriptional regulator [Paenibacillus sp. PL91]|uniref:LuxR C-terminal-related transcriptional regulator n=1 Tax=Paenibacillus sp. PL91 TaxID=2729538 RepID=UPI00145E2A4D|nr:LuxR C-terminal-related transcriptional regulator [Paenibacillus sp. PL91]MBC9199916.1 LuxR family transcriptional regulator [Paenibacillus sp. PL91]
MSTPIISTKLYIPPPRPNAVFRPRLFERLNEGLSRRLTLISASAGYGKTTLVSEWLVGCERPFAWLSLDEGDNDPIRFLSYLIAALQKIAANIGESVFGMLHSPHGPPIESILTTLINQLTAIPDHFILVLDDYHVIDAKPVEKALSLIIEHMPPQMHMVIISREDPHLPLARLRVRDQLTELRVADLRFTHSEAAGFLNQMMGLNLLTEDIALLEARTEGWIAGLQLAAISMKGLKDTTSFIKSFTGSHHFVLDYLIEEVLQQQPESVQTFLLCTSILDRMCGPLCDAVLSRAEGEQTDAGVFSKSSLHQGAFSTGQETLLALEHANLFIVPLDNERRWYRYHHLFADLLRQRLQLSAQSPKGDAGSSAAELHVRASRWYEENGLEIEAFQHAAAANDIERAARLIEGNGMPLHFRGAVAPVRNWLESLPSAILDERPSLWVIYASVLLFGSQMAGVEQKLKAAEAALQGAEPNEKTDDLMGHIAAIRATLAVTQHEAETILVQSRRALEYLHPGNLPVRTATIWTLGYAYHLQGDRVSATKAYTEAISISEAIGHFIITIMATIGLGNMQEADNRLDMAAKSYRRVLQLAGDLPLLVVCEAHLGLARIGYEWNDMDAAGQHGQKSVQLAIQLEDTDRLVACELILARLKLAQGDLGGAAAIVSKAAQFVRQHHFVHRVSEIAAVQALVLLRQGHLAAAAKLVQKHEIPLVQARVHLAKGDTAAVLDVLVPLLRQMEAKGWEDERLRIMVLLSVALQEHGEKDKAIQLLRDALALAESGGFIRIFIDEGIPMAGLLSDAAARGIMKDYIVKLKAVFEAKGQRGDDYVPAVQPLIEPLSQRELIVLQLIAQGLSNHEISDRLFIALDTVKGHNRRIFGKLQVQRRTEAVARARELGLL